MSRAAVIVVTLIVLLVSAAVVGWSFFGLGTSSSLSLQPAMQPTTPPPQATQPPAQSDKQVTLPVGLKAPGVKFVRATYTFETTIKEIRGTPERLELITSLEGGTIPQFIVTSATNVLRKNNGTKEKISSSALTPNQKVEIAIPYRLRQKVWADVVSVDIQGSSNTSAAAPSAGESQ